MYDSTMLTADRTFGIIGFINVSIKCISIKRSNDLTFDIFAYDFNYKNGNEMLDTIQRMESIIEIGISVFTLS